jgi:hypothetical protein
LGIEASEHALLRHRRRSHWFNPQPRQSSLHIKQKVWIEKRRHILAQGGPVLNLLGGTAVVAGTSQGSPAHQFVLQTHGGSGFRHG